MIPRIWWYRAILVCAALTLPGRSAYPAEYPNWQDLLSTKTAGITHLEVNPSSAVTPYFGPKFGGIEEIGEGTTGIADAIQYTIDNSTSAPFRIHVWPNTGQYGGYGMATSQSGSGREIQSDTEIVGHSESVVPAEFKDGIIQPTSGTLVRIISGGMSTGNPDYFGQPFNNVHIANIHFKKFVRARNIENVTIDNCFFEVGSQPFGSLIEQNTTSTLVYNCVFNNAYQTPTLPAVGISLAGNKHKIRNTTFSNCFIPFAGVYPEGIDLGTDAEPGKNLFFKNEKCNALFELSSGEVVPAKGNTWYPKYSRDSGGEIVIGETGNYLPLSTEDSILDTIIVNTISPGSIKANMASYGTEQVAVGNPYAIDPLSRLPMGITITYSKYAPVDNDVWVMY